MKTCKNCGTEFSGKQCPPCMDKCRKAWIARNPEKRKLYREAWRARNPEKVAAMNRKPRATKVECEARRKSSKLKARLPWCNEFFISQAYEIARVRTKLTGVKWHVDHIVPLQSKLVCGLHNEFNLRVITASENCAKGNRVWPDMPE